MSYDPFFIYYYCSKQIHVYRKYCKHSLNSKLLINATRLLVKNFEKLGKTKQNLYIFIKF